MAAPAVLLALAAFGPAAATPFRAIAPQPASATDQIVTLTGHDLTVEQVVAVARYGQSVEVSPEAARHQDDAHNLLLEGAAEGIAIAGFNRGGDNGSTILFDGDPAAPENQPAIQQRALASFQGAVPTGPEIAEEEIVRAMMVVRANTLAYAPASAPVTQMLLDFLNNRITPVVGATGNPLTGVAAAMVGKGDAYYHGIRMPAAQALAQAGLMPVAPVDADYGAFTETGAYDTGRTALLVGDGRLALEWSDLIYAMDLNGMNAGIAPLALPAQANRPFKWIYWDAARVLDMIKGSFLFDEDPGIATGPRPYPAKLSLSLTRQGTAWRAWADLRDVVLIALNSSDQAWAIRVGMSPRESPELGTPQMMRYYVKGGKISGGKRGFVAPALNRDPYPLANDVAAFTSAFGMLDAALAPRVAAPPPAAPQAGTTAPQAGDDGPVPLNRARQVLEGTFSLLAVDLADAAKLLDQRAAEIAGRTFGAAPTASWMAFRTTVSAQTAGDAAQTAAWQFIQSNQPAIFYPKGEPPLGSDDPIPLAQEKIR
jgi:histidine ammonia-lyase